LVSVLASGAVDRGYESQSGQIKEYIICMCCFSAKHTSSRRKSEDGTVGIRIMCLNGTICLSVDCCFIVLELWKTTN